MKFLFLILVSLQAFAQDYYSFGLRAHLYQPSTIKSGMPILVLLHGCKMGESEFTELTGALQVQNEKSFAVLSIEQSVYNNYDHCWNWFFVTNQTTGWSNEPFIIKNFIESIKNDDVFKKSKVFVAGFSSGAAIALNTSYLFPSLFDGVLLHSGVAFKLARNAEVANHVLTNPPVNASDELIKDTFFGMSHPQDLEHIKKWIVVHGKNDQRVSFKHKSIIVEQLLGCFDYKDDHRANDSVKLFKKSEMYSPSNKYPYSIEKTLIDGKIELLDISIDELKHSWSGGSIGPYADIQGPEITKLMLEEFKF